jgi:hypothetical protein
MEPLNDFNQQRFDSVIAAFRRLKFVYLPIGAFRVEVNLAGAFNKSLKDTVIYLRTKGKRGNRLPTFVVNRGDVLERWKVAENRLHYAQKNFVTGAITWLDTEIKRLGQ